MSTETGITKGTRVRYARRLSNTKISIAARGTVLRRRGDAVFVRWDGTHSVDQRHIAELRRLARSGEVLRAGVGDE